MRALLTARLVTVLAVTALAACERGAREPSAGESAELAMVETPEEVTELLSPIRSAALVAVEYAELGAQRTAREDTRRYGQTVGADHRALVGTLDSAARTRGATLHETAAARELEQTVRMARAGLETLPDAEFELAFVRAEVEAHRQLVDTIDHELIPAAMSEALRTLVRDSRAMAYAHLTRARQLLGDLLGEPVEPPPPGAPGTEPGG
jgi:predicted outer membrane protein